jgi:hypothetical protein
MMMHHMKPHRDDRYHDFHHHRHPMEDKGEVVIDQDYDNFIKVPDVLNEGELPELKILQQAITVKSEYKKTTMNIKFGGRGMPMMEFE